VLVLGDGKDEIEELFKTANVLPAGYSLAVKEHPEMLGRREFGFYRRIKKHKNMILIDPFVSNIDLIKKSVGVIGISGTSLLEAAFLNKPSCSLGKPEFSEFLIENGWESANIFFEKVISSLDLASKEKILPYVAYIISNSISADLMSEVGEEKSSNQEILTHFAKKIYEHLTSHAL
jgi:hypothetical protein